MAITSTEEALWQLLDDISTLFDIHKPKETGFTKAVWKRCESRIKYLYSPDGYKLKEQLIGVAEDQD